MRILVVHGRYRSAAPSGENNVVDRESAALAAAGHDVHRFERHSDDIDTWSTARKATLPVKVIWNGESRRDLAACLAEVRPDVVHVHNTFPMLSPSVLHACRDAGIPVVATIHNYKLLCASGDFFREGQPCHSCASGTQLPALRHGCYRGSRAATLSVVASTTVHRAAWRELVSAYIFISAAQRDLMKGLALPPERAFVKHNFVPSVDAPPASADGTRAPLVAALGRLDAAKGTPLLMQAWDAFRAARPDSTLRLAVAGSGPLDGEVAAWAARHPSVDVLGHLRPDAARALLRSARAAVVPSQWEETFGLVAVEAMAAAVPPIAPARGSFPELVTDDVDGVLFTPGDPAALAAVFADVGSEPERYAELGEQARRTYLDRFTVEGNVERLLDIYRYAIAHPVRATEPVGEGIRS